MVTKNKLDSIIQKATSLTVGATVGTVILGFSALAYFASQDNQERKRILDQKDQQIASSTQLLEEKELTIHDLYAQLEVAELNSGSSKEQDSTVLELNNQLEESKSTLEHHQEKYQKASGFIDETYLYRLCEAYGSYESEGTLTPLQSVLNDFRRNLSHDLIFVKGSDILELLVQDHQECPASRYKIPPLTRDLTKEIGALIDEGDLLVYTPGQEDNAKLGRRILTHLPKEE
ncbi:hypothetical protein HOC13_04415 [Candidatus Woesearchaeota archaeon]|jgi:gas vesicle protein|nr:hypothetical protein [Candidatus Woesearchaeota archaeon]